MRSMAMTYVMLSAVVLLFALLAFTPATAATTRKVALGVSIHDGRDPAVLDRFSASVGRKPALWTTWGPWGAGKDRLFPTAMCQALRERNIQPFVWWEPGTPGNFSDPTYARHRNTLNGMHDAYIRQYARDARAVGGPVLLRLAHEMNNNYFPWSVQRFDNSPQTFIAFWRYIHRIFREEGATNVKWVWSPNKQKCAGGCNPYKVVYPGDAYVDYIGFTAYNWFRDNKWQSMYDSISGISLPLREVSKKPQIVAETGCNAIGGDKAAWIRAGYREVYRRLPFIQAIVWLSVDLRNIGHPDWRIESPASALTAYQEIAALPQFDTRWAGVVNGGGDTTTGCPRGTRQLAKGKRCAAFERRVTAGAATCCRPASCVVLANGAKRRGKCVPRSVAPNAKRGNCAKGGRCVVKRS